MQLDFPGLKTARADFSLESTVGEFLVFWVGFDGTMAFFSTDSSSKCEEELLNVRISSSLSESSSTSFFPGEVSPGERERGVVRGFGCYRLHWNYSGKKWKG